MLEIRNSGVKLRSSAIKTLPEEFDKDADRIARFESEAKLLASLNHPNIAQICGLEKSTGVHVLVMTDAGVSQNHPASVSLFGRALLAISHTPHRRGE